MNGRIIKNILYLIILVVIISLAIRIIGAILWFLVPFAIVIIAAYIIYMFVKRRKF